LTRIPIYHFPWWEWTNQPDWAEFGFLEQKSSASLSELLIFPGPVGSPNKSGWIDEDKVTALLTDPLLQPGDPAFISIEGTYDADDNPWQTYSVDELGNPTFQQSGLDWRMELLDFCRTINPDLWYGNYQQPSPNDYLILSKHDQWREQCVEPLAPLFAEQDIAIPQFYFRSVDSPYWWSGKGLGDALEIIDRQLNALDTYASSRPVWPIMWQEWWDDFEGEIIRYTINGDDWRALLSLTLNRADGMFLWKEPRDREWDPDAEWWAVTLDLIPPVRSDIPQTDVMTALVDLLRTELNLDDRQCFLSLEPGLPTIPMGGDYWLTVSPGDGVFVDGEQAEDNCTEETTVTVTAYARMMRDSTDRDTKTLQDATQGLLALKGKVLDVLVGADPIGNNNTFARDLIFAQRASRPGVKSNDIAAWVSTDFGVNFDWSFS
jgi:hypothetical protein